MTKILKLVLATQNTHKVEEISALLPAGIQAVTMREMGLLDDIEESASTLKDNALLKARYVWERLKLPVLADDSGLEVLALGGAPGVMSARYAGKEKDAEANMAKLLEVLRNEPFRDARFVTFLAFIDESGQEFLFEGEIRGRILGEKRGMSGFGYDPIFRPEGDERSFAEMRADEKNRISHRARALQAFLCHLLNKL